MNDNKYVKVIAEKIINGDDGYESATYDAWRKANNKASQLLSQLTSEMTAVMEAGTTIIEEMGEGETKTSTWGREYTEQEERQEVFEEVFNELAGEIGLMRDGTEFWEPSTC